MSSILLSFVLLTACDDQAGTRDAVVAQANLPAGVAASASALAPLRIAAARTPTVRAIDYESSDSVASVAHAGMTLIAQARYCWPSFRFRGELPSFDKGVADEALANADATLPPKCIPEPPAVARFVKELRETSSQDGVVAPLTPMQHLLRAVGYAPLAFEGCTGALRNEKPAPLRRRWRSEVRIKRTGDPTIDAAFATVLADERFQAAMNGIRVSLVSDHANVIVTRSLSKICEGGGAAFCGHQPATTRCTRGSDSMAREALARRVTDGRRGYFPSASDFGDNSPIELGVGGFTVGDGRTIFGAVCIGLGRDVDAPSARPSSTRDQAAAASCLLRALGIAGRTSPNWLLVGQSPRKPVKLTTADETKAIVSTEAFDILRSIYSR